VRGSLSLSHALDGAGEARVMSEAWLATELTPRATVTLEADLTTPPTGHLCHL
jgi:hypothetical protein